MVNGLTVAGAEGSHQSDRCGPAAHGAGFRRLPQPRIVRVAHSGSANKIRKTVFSTAFCQKPDSSE